MSSTRVTQRVKAARADIYRALLDPRAVARWMVPDGMTCHVHELEPREGGRLRISLTYEAPTGAGETTAHTDTYHGTFVKLVPDRFRAAEKERRRAARGKGSTGAARKPATSQAKRTPRSRPRARTR